jgi:hypothetical protein
MDKETLKKILQLDSIFGILTYKERVLIHLIMQGKIDTATPYLRDLYNWCLDWDWQPPKTRYGQDRLLYFENAPGQWELIEELKKIDLKIPKR